MALFGHKLSQLMDVLQVETAASIRSSCKLPNLFGTILGLLDVVMICRSDSELLLHAVNPSTLILEITEQRLYLTLQIKSSVQDKAGLVFNGPNLHSMAVQTSSHTKSSTHPLLVVLTIMANSTATPGKNITKISMVAKHQQLYTTFLPKIMRATLLQSKPVTLMDAVRCLKFV